jgi:hypothetical protein
VASSLQWQFAVAVHVLAFLAGTLEGSIVSSEELSTSTNINRVYVRRTHLPTGATTGSRMLPCGRALRRRSTVHCSSVVIGSQGGVVGGDAEDGATGQFVVGCGQGDVLGGGVAVAEELAQPARLVQGA